MIASHEVVNRILIESTTNFEEVVNREKFNRVYPWTGISIRLLQLSNYLKVPINYFFEDFSEYLINIEKSKEGHMNVNYNFLVKVYSELTQDQKIKFNKNIQITQGVVSKVG